jgi:phosphoribosylaminoimidazole carboxylase PurE protein
MKVVMLLGSESDKGFAEEIDKQLREYGIGNTEVLVASAHKVPERVFEIVSKNNQSEEPMVYVTIAGRSNGLSGVTAGNSVHPVIACPPFKDNADFMVNINSTLCMPSDTPVLTVIDRQNVVMAILRIFGLFDPEMRKKVADRIANVKSKFNN